MTVSPVRQHLLDQVALFTSRGYTLPQVAIVINRNCLRTSVLVAQARRLGMLEPKRPSNVHA